MPGLDAARQAGDRCRICGSRRMGRSIGVREMMHGLRHPFQLEECADCGSLNLIDAGLELADYYPKAYQAFGALPRYGRRGPYVACACVMLPLPFLDRVAQATRRAIPQHVAEVRHALRQWLGFEPPRSWRILDVGCGSGALLCQLNLLRYRRVEGLEPFGDAPAGAPCLIHRMFFTELEGQYDLVMFHHSLEHMQDPGTVLAHLRHCLAPGGLGLIRLPKVPSQVFEEYGRFWYELDPPRHAFVPSMAGLTSLFARHGLKVVRQLDEPNLEEYVWSDAYRRDLPMVGTNPQTVYSADEIAGFEDRARDAAARGQAGRAIFVVQAQS